MSIRARLVFLVLAVLVPAIIVAVCGIVYVYLEEKQSVEKGLVETSRALALVVDRELASREAVLRTLSSSPSLELGDVERFQRQCQTLEQQWGFKITLLDANRQIVSSFANPESAEVLPPLVPEPPTPDKIVNVTNLFKPSPSAKYSFALERPVVRDGRTIYYITMTCSADQLQSVLDAQGLPEGWLGVILDRQGIIVARNRRPDMFVGSSASESALMHVRQATQGIFKSVTRDKVPSLTAFSRAPISDWIFLVAVPRKQIGESATSAIVAVSIISMGLLTLGSVFAMTLGRRIVEPVSRLADSAEALGRGEMVRAGSTGLKETDTVSLALESAGEQIRDASALMASRVAEAVADSERSYKALLQAQKLEALGRLTGGIAHDFNNLLQALSTGLHLADLLATDNEAKEALASCKRALGRATRLTRQLMAFGRNQVSEARTLDLRNQLLAMEDLFRGALRSDIQLNLDFAEDLWSVHVDPLQLEMAVLNLAFNARDAIPQKGNLSITGVNRTITDGEVASLPAGEYVQLAVKDNGEGMSEEVAAQALDPFFTTKAPGKGSGMGLAQVYGFVKQSEGGITLVSRVGQGTAVTLFLPRSLEQNEGAVAEVEGPTNAMGPRATVLIVEDDVLVRNVIGPALVRYGFEVITAGHAEEALAKLEEREDIDVVFTDVVMPGNMNGIQLCEAIRLRNPVMPVVLATGYSEHEQGLPKNIKTISKPYDVDAVASALRTALPQKHVGDAEPTS